jgi:chemosensory pili system protein ChpA (sensor histidine kinase/response regulator)
VLPRWGSHRVSGIVVDEVLGESEFVIKPLPAYLRRPGLAGTAIDGRERILLVLDLPELISAYASRPRIESREPTQDQVPSPRQPQEPKILIADDSVSMRLSLRQTLSHAHYTVMEASDGLEALELLQTHVPDVLLLDIEMPNLNGYDLLNLMRLRPELATVKTIMLTSRSSEQHMKHALELGAYGYLTKPCPLETLLNKVQEALGQGARSDA